tara:strand:- start:358 stop:1494 length:1137 start_codon:yes stop_codon:yes gene_type:complete
MKVELSSIQQNLVGTIEGIGYVESIGHAMIEYVEILIGGQVIQRIPSDFLAIYSDNYVTQTKQHNLAKLIGKPPLEFSGTNVRQAKIAGYLGLATTDTKYFVDIPFYFYNNPELAVPLCAITGQEIEIVIKLRDLKDCVWGYDTTDPANNNSIFYLGDFVQTKGLIKSLKLTTEMVSLDEEEKQMISSKKMDYIITQIQESKSIIPQDSSASSIVDVKHKLKFKNPVKELFFIIQTLRKELPSSATPYFVTNFDYDSDYQLYNGEYVNYEHLQNLEIQLDDSVILDKVTGNVINLRAIQSGIHHSRTQLFRRYYSYSFALEPERWYPTGQRNFSLIKEQDIKLRILPDQNAKRELRVLGLSYNILRVENGIAKTLFNL